MWRGGLWHWTHKANRLEVQFINAVGSNTDEGAKIFNFFLVAGRVGVGGFAMIFSVVFLVGYFFQPQF
jgi:hypothetical protein